MKVISVVGARPNFMKVAPIHRALEADGRFESLILHTGQHYDHKMSEVFFQELGLPEPHVNLEVGSGSHAIQTAEVMMRFEQYVLEEEPDIVLVYGDVNSTVASSLVCSKLGIPIGHVEAGLRSFDRTMPEEINRLITDQIADVLFTPSRDGDENLINEGVAPERIHFVGNVMIDTLVRLLPQAESRWPSLRSQLDVKDGGYGLVTLHRPSNVDDEGMLPELVRVLDDIAADVPLLFPVHPRTRKRMADLGLAFNNVQVVDPLGYLDFVALQRFSKLVITDSGGIQEETTYLGVPCLTVRENTERPVTVTEGTNILVGRNLELLREEVERILTGAAKRGTVPELWDGKTGERIAHLVTELGAGISR